ncbi:alanyl-tRNA editing protein [Pantoea sp. KPR_PJ]|uniref:alanyl-tRNA editing protein n=1 Tax=Pantoea sp. KPR_PJ TaxID=2738375 RepID=UPI0035270966
MTERVYYTSDALEMETDVVSCTRQEDGRFHVVLSATLFHPQGGGQPSDRGTINGVPLLQAIQDGHTLVHIMEGPVQPGKAHLLVDAEVRNLHTRYHSAGHIIGLAGEKFGWLGVKGNHKPGDGRIVFDALATPEPMTIEALATEIGALVQRSESRIITEAEGKRLVTWGTLKPYACGGTHVLNTAEIGDIRLIKMKEKKGQLSVQYELDA